MIWRVSGSLPHGAHYKLAGPDVGHFETELPFCFQSKRSQVFRPRFHGMEEVDGSNPSRSTNHLGALLPGSGAHFRATTFPFHAEQFIDDRLLDTQEVCSSSLHGPTTSQRLVRFCRRSSSDRPPVNSPNGLDLGVYLAGATSATPEVCL